MRRLFVFGLRSIRNEGTKEEDGLIGQNSLNPYKISDILLTVLYFPYVSFEISFVFMNKKKTTDSL